jgi:hypothetical protein
MKKLIIQRPIKASNSPNTGLIANQGYGVSGAGMDGADGVPLLGKLRNNDKKLINRYEKPAAKLKKKERKR